MDFYSLGCKTGDGDLLVAANFNSGRVQRPLKFKGEMES